MTLQLFLRSPLRFGAAIALLGVLDSFAVSLAEGSGLQRASIDRLGTVMLPCLWVIISVLARGADDARQNWLALSELRRQRVWLSALRAGVALAIFLWVVGWALHGLGDLLSRQRPRSYLEHPGELLTSIAANVLFLQSWVGVCYCPLIVFRPELSAIEAGHLSRKASELNGHTLIFMLFGVLSFSAVCISDVMPLSGMTDAALLVFLGILNYVAYRDIFERRSHNLPAFAPSVIQRSASTQPP